MGYSLICDAVPASTKLNSKNRYRRFSGVISGRRFYDPKSGRWISKDPIEERGGKNLYGAMGNDPVLLFDYLGLKCVFFVTSSSGGGEKEVTAPSAVNISDKMTEIRGGDFHDNIFRVDYSMWHGYCMRINFILDIHINPDNVKKTHASGDYAGYNKHFLKGKKLDGGMSVFPVRDAVVAHEQGHAKAYFEIAKSKIEKAFEFYCNLDKYSTPAQRKALEQEIQTKLNAIVNEDEAYLQKSADEANNGEVGYYSNGGYSSITPPVLPPETLDLTKWDYVWKKN